jgi:hypothetical protein
MAADVGEIARLHAHAAPHAALLERAAQTVASAVADEIAERAVVVVEVAGLAFEQPVELERIAIGPVGQQHDVLAVVTKRLGLRRIDDDGAVDARLLLEAGVRVIPVRAALPRVEAVGERLAGRYAVKAHARHPVHVRRQQDAVPMNRRVGGERVVHAQDDGVAFAEAQHRSRQRAVHDRADGRAAGQIHGRLGDRKVELVATQLSCGRAPSHAQRRPRAERRQHRRGGRASYEPPPGGRRPAVFAL